jgi:hypothetical protein
VRLMTKKVYEDFQEEDMQVIDNAFKMWVSEWVSECCVECCVECCAEGVSIAYTLLTLPYCVCVCTI